MNHEASHNANGFDDPASDKQPARKLQLVRAGSLQFGVFADDIATIVAWREPTPLPNAPKSVLGVVSVQGRMLTVLDLTSLSSGIEAAQSDAPGDAPDDPPVDASRVVSSAGRNSLVALRGDEQLALAVDEVGETVELEGGAFEAQPENSGKSVLGVSQLRGAQIKILNLKELFPAAIHGRERRRRRF